MHGQCGTSIYLLVNIKIKYTSFIYFNAIFKKNIEIDVKEKHVQLYVSITLFKYDR